MTRLDLRCIGFAVLLLLLAACQSASAEEWTTLKVPGTWETQADGQFKNYDGFAWYRCVVEVPEEWRDDLVQLQISNVDNAHEAYVNGVRIGGTGQFPPNYKNGLESPGRYRLDGKTLKFGTRNVIALRVFDADGQGGFKGRAPALAGVRDAIELAGVWEFRTGDDLAWARGEGIAVDRVLFKRLVPLDALFSTPGSQPGALSPLDALKSLKTPPDLAVDLVLSEPQIEQPVFLNFDARGRMWVVEYRQYPEPAGLTMRSRDQFWRIVYDKLPLPPPHGVRGKDRISIHTDTDGDGTFDDHKVFVDGLNIATACVTGQGGVWVLNPPFLLFYPDANGDDIPDADPVVHLEGFGMEDTHSVVNSLTWGPDGWLYGAQGSTVSGNVRRPGVATAVKSQGQLIWRYHPALQKYEVFAEGGGNAFGCEIDSAGRIFSGHNGGDTRGFYYPQGGYLQKGFGKHGPLSNPYAFGYYPAMKHHNVPRFTHTFTFYEADLFPPVYHGKLFGVAPLLSHVVMSTREPLGSTFKTQDIGYAISTPDTWFKPVDIKLGPDGALYVADWYDAQSNHFRNHEGQIDRTNGRIYRLRPQEWQAQPAENLTSLSRAELLQRLSHPNRTVRQQAVRVLVDRADSEAAAKLAAGLRANSAAAPLEALWIVAQLGHLDDDLATALLKHPDARVRTWTVRLSCDDGDISSGIRRGLVELAQSEPDVEVRLQLAASVRRLPLEPALAILAPLCRHDVDASDPQVPLMIWWAFERHLTAAPAAAPEPGTAATSTAATKAGGLNPAGVKAVLAILGDRSLWERPLVAEHLLSRLMRRIAVAGTRENLLLGLDLLRLAPTPEAARALAAGFEEAFQGRTLSSVPEELLRELVARGASSELLSIRLRQPDAVAAALRAVADPATERTRLLALMSLLGEIREPRAEAPLLDRLNTGEVDTQVAALQALAQLGSAQGTRVVLNAIAKWPVELQSAGWAFLASRHDSAVLLVAAVDRDEVPSQSVPVEIVRRMTVYRDAALQKQIANHWKSLSGATTQEMQRQIERVKTVSLASQGSPYPGKKLFGTLCAKCHRLHEQGGQIGPDLTPFKRDDLDTLLLNVINPSAEIREGFESYTILDQEGRATTGFLVDQDPQIVVLRDAEGQSLTFAREHIDEMLPQRRSLMPEGLLQSLSDTQVRDLLAYLRSSQPLAD